MELWGKLPLPKFDKIIYIKGKYFTQLRNGFCNYFAIRLYVDLLDILIYENLHCRRQSLVTPAIVRYLSLFSSVHHAVNDTPFISKDPTGSEFMI